MLKQQSVLSVQHSSVVPDDDQPKTDGHFVRLLQYSSIMLLSATRIVERQLKYMQEREEKERDVPIEKTLNQQIDEYDTKEKDENESKEQEEEKEKEKDKESAEIQVHKEQVDKDKEESKMKNRN